MKRRVIITYTALQVIGALSVLLASLVLAGALLRLGWEITALLIRV